MYAGLAGLVIVESISDVCTCPSSQFQLLNQPCSPTQIRSLLNPDQLLNVGQHTSLPELVLIDAENADCPLVSMVEKV